MCLCNLFIYLFYLALFFNYILSNFSTSTIILFQLDTKVTFYLTFIFYFSLISINKYDFEYFYFLVLVKQCSMFFPASELPSISTIHRAHIDLKAAKPSQAQTAHYDRGESHRAAPNLPK